VDGWSAPRPGRFTHGEDPVPIVQKVGWAPGPVLACVENLAHTGNLSPVRPARSESLDRLIYPGPFLITTVSKSSEPSTSKKSEITHQPTHHHIQEDPNLKEQATFL
jgi:hypothetical protein